MGNGEVRDLCRNKTIVCKIQRIQTAGEPVALLGLSYQCNKKAGQAGNKDSIQTWKDFVGHAKELELRLCFQSG